MRLTDRMICARWMISLLFSSVVRWQNRTLPELLFRSPRWDTTADCWTSDTGPFCRNEYSRPSRLLGLPWKKINNITRNVRVFLCEIEKLTLLRSWSSSSRQPWKVRLRVPNVCLLPFPPRDTWHVPDIKRRETFLRYRNTLAGYRDRLLYFFRPNVTNNTHRKPAKERFFKIHSRIW